MKKGVPGDCILIENKSTNTGENVRFSRAVLEKAGIPEPSSIIALQKPYMERRTLATLQAQWPEVRVAVSSPPFFVQGISDQGAPAGSGCFRHGGGLSKDTGIS